MNLTVFNARISSKQNGILPTTKIFTIILLKNSTAARNSCWPKLYKICHLSHPAFVLYLQYGKA
jgi:hypothetical protein